MGISSISKIGTGRPDRTVTKKLNVEDFVFEINNRDIFNVSISYYFDKIETSYYVNGEKKNIVEDDLISISLSGNSSEGKEAWVSFDIASSLEKLNTYTDIPVEITKDIVEGETFIKYPESETSTFLDFNIPTKTQKDIFLNMSSAWISKIENNIFIIKLCVLNNLFTYFKIDFNELIGK